MNYKYITVVVAAGGAEENLADVFNLIGGKARTIHSLRFNIAGASSPTAAVRGRMTINQMEWVDFDLDSFNDRDSDSYAHLSVNNEIEIMTDVGANDTVKVGFYLASGDPSGKVVVKYVDK